MHSSARLDESVIERQPAEPLRTTFRGHSSGHLSASQHSRPPAGASDKRYIPVMAPRDWCTLLIASLGLTAFSACGSDGPDEGGLVSGGAGRAGSAGSLSLEPLAGSSATGVGGDDGRGPGPAPGTLPPGFTKADVGGYKLGDPITSDEGDGAAGAPSDDEEGCGTTILAVVRDFTPEHPDFEAAIAPETGLVEKTLGADRKPVFARSGATQTVSGPDSFDEWYRNGARAKPYVLEVFFAPSSGNTSFQSRAFFPLDGAGFGNGQNAHNFHFTTEIHTRFRYRGGEVFNFSGDDDVWIFINDQLVVDLGGVHGAQDARLEVDVIAGEAGIQTGNVYAFDMFHAERHTSESNFRADTNLEFVDCGTIVPDVPK